MEKARVATEVAEDDFSRIAKFLRLDAESEMDAKERRIYLDAKKTICRAISDGLVTVDSEGRATYLPPSRNMALEAEGFTFGRRATGATLMATEDFNERQNVSKLFAVVAQLTGSRPDACADLDKHDLDVMFAFGGLFLA